MHRRLAGRETLSGQVCVDVRERLPHTPPTRLPPQPHRQAQGDCAPHHTDEKAEAWTSGSPEDARPAQRQPGHCGVRVPCRGLCTPLNGSFPRRLRAQRRHSGPRAGSWLRKPGSHVCFPVAPPRTQFQSVRFSHPPDPSAVKLVHGVHHDPVWRRAVLRTEGKSCLCVSWFLDHYCSHPIKTGIFITEHAFGPGSAVCSTLETFHESLILLLRCVRNVSPARAARVCDLG